MTHGGESGNLEVDFDRAVNDLKGVHAKTSAHHKLDTIISNKREHYKARVSSHKLKRCSKKLTLVLSTHSCV